MIGNKVIREKHRSKLESGKSTKNEVTNIKK